MLDYIKKHSKLEFEAEMLKRANSNIEESKLTNLEKEITKYVANTSNSKPEDWIDNALLKGYRRGFFNFSAFVDTGYHPRILKNGQRKRFTYEA